MSDLSDIPSRTPPIAFNQAGFVSLLLDDGNVQSLMRKSKPYRLELGYTRTMMGFLLFQPAPRHIAMIGLGGGSIPKHCYRQIQDVRITAIEIDPEVIALRDRFYIPPDGERFQVICGDGAAFVAQQLATLDVLLVDGFDTGGQAPQLCTQAFYDAAYDSLDAEGVMVVNVLGADRHFDDYLERIRRSFKGQVAVSKSEDCDNRIIFAVKGLAYRLPMDMLEDRAKTLGRRHQLPLRQPLADILKSRT
jgi:spermidine synthase